jgi:hypothetical protein
MSLNFTGAKRMNFFIHGLLFKLDDFIGTKSTLYLIYIKKKNKKHPLHFKKIDFSDINPQPFN